MNIGTQITARTVTFTSVETGRASSKVVVELSGNPDPRWQSCFNFVVQGRDGLYMEGRPRFDRSSFEGVLPTSEVDAFRHDLPEVLASTDTLARAQARKDADRH
ncbi:hypothetical protein MUG10_07285 [Xanthomonas prunicola]|uniref:Uncharacterized protein n=1 Tax=Xanthomonas prunicola TaxID=2053930 RepID=A0A9Q9J5V1_9XANT|nr:hypothetical protein [Xanthomonas prunicola]USJ01941.1 hypothetical protein MUG10_07285 [Xanthomonas prunicola]UXA50435.1 hypothetical protein M0D44_08020 [Xanthomonas prunicola]UXA55326.1 hypothetical protein M0D45_14040 [Xanthomonas prunicola]UXA58744.1 hypothetical protein M0D47_08055 [Xanthomonas prunicola]UXA60887.1 hypothetical protein M0D48_18345 [Xanthomonas prunicola]